jgi:O-antigen/teichoic acid export membrane protein
LTSEAPLSIDTADGAPPASSLLKLRRISASDRRIVLVSIATVVSRLFAKLAQLAFLIIAARLLSVAEFAGYSYLLVLAVTFSLLADTGVALAASREISAGRRPAAEAFWSSAPVVGLGAVLGAGCVLVFGLVDSAPGSSGAALLLTCLFVGMNTLFNFAATTLRGVGRSVYEALLQGLGAAAFVGVGAAALALGGGLATILALLLVKEVVSAALAFGALREDVGPPRRWTPHLWHRLLQIGIQLGIASAALALVTRVPTVVLGNKGSTTDLAWFSGAQRLADAVLLLATTSGFAILPSLAFLFASEETRAWRLLWRVLAVAGVGGGLLGLLAIVLAPQIVTVVYGSDFEDAAEATRVVMAGAPALAVAGIGWYALVALGRERRLVMLAATAAALSLVLSLTLIPGSGDVGAAIAYLGAVVLVAVAILGSLARVRRADRP